MAIVIVLIGLVMMTLFPALVAVRSSSQRSLTQSNLQALLTATASYAQANGCLPCPAPAGVYGAGFGHVRGDASASPAACGTCATPNGIVPFASLGLPMAMARDGWSHWISMRVDSALTGGGNFTVLTPPTSPCQCSDFTTSSLPSGCSTTSAGTTATPTCTVLNASQKGLCRTGLSKTNRLTINTPNGTTTPSSQSAAVIFVSHGALGFGSYFASSQQNFNDGYQLPFPSPVACSTLGGYAECNAQGIATTGVFYNAPTVTGGADPYDDMITFADRNMLLSMLGNGGCQTVW